MLAHLLHAFSGRDNQSVDMGRVLWAVSVLALIVFQAHTVWTDGHFDPIAFSGGCAAILAGGGAALGMKATTEPGALPPTQGASP